MLITIISEIDDALQAWRVNIDPADLAALMEKYDGLGSSVVDDADGIAEEIRTAYRTK